jgi:nucleoside-triphosphatase THEP1
MNMLLTGTRGVGKTTVCQAMADLARAEGRAVGGVLTPLVLDSDGVKAGFEAHNLANGERWLLAHMQRPLDGPRVGAYVFDSSGLAGAIAAIRAAMTNGVDLLFLDEVGPLELERGEGFAPLLKELHLDGPGHVCMVVRPSLLPELRRRLGRIDFGIYTVTEQNRTILPPIILRELFPEG